MLIVKMPKLGLGGCKFAITWVDADIVVQRKVGSFIVTLIVDENFNLGLIEEHFESLKKIMAPLDASNILT